MKPKSHITFPQFTGIRCLMMPYIQGESDSVPLQFRLGYESILESIYLQKGAIGFLTIDESQTIAGKPHRGAHARYARALHTEAGKLPGIYAWGGCTWGGKANVILAKDTKVLLANSIDKSCAVWDSTHEDTTEDGDIGHLASQYPYESATLMHSGDVYEIGILTPHESLPIKESTNRQFLRIVGSGVYGREPYFTENPLLAA